MPGKAAATCLKPGRVLPDEESWRASQMVSAHASLFMDGEAFARLDSKELVICGRGIKGIKTARTLAERYAEMMIVRHQTRQGMEYAVAERAAVRRATGRSL